MQPTDKPRFATIVTCIYGLKDKTPTKVQLEAWWIAMQADWTIEEFEAAAAKVMQTAEYLATPADFAKLRKAATPDAGAAWALVMQHIRSGKYRDGIPIGDPVIDAAAAAVGGYKAIAFHDVDKLHFLARTFGEHFETAQNRHETLAALPNLKPPGGLPPLPAPAGGTLILPNLRADRPRA